MTKSKGVRAPRRPWTEAELTLLRQNYAESLTQDIATALGRSLSTTYQQARRLGLLKSPQWVADTARERACRPDHGGRKTHFVKGLPSWSKGTKGRVGVQEACRATQFKKGRPPEESRNYKPIGSYRIIDGHLEQKVSDDPTVYPARRWTPVYRLVWIAANGEVPEGHLIRFLPGMATIDPALITADKLECISREEHMRRHTFHQYGPDVASVVQLRGAITRQINKRAKEST